MLVCKWPALGMLWTTARSNVTLCCAVDVVEPVLGASARLERWFREVTVFAAFWSFQLRRRRPATTVHRALPVCEWSALGMP